MSGNRRKKNVSSASSARAAELLSSSGHTLSFLGIDGSLAATNDSNDFEPGNEIEPELIQIFKKLAKKDPQTREKALREICSVSFSKDPKDSKAAYDYYCTIFDKLSLDSSVSVRSLSLKVLSFYIEVLKKSAEKNLEKVIPFVLLASCDPLTSVVNASDNLLQTCFPDKAEKVVKLFSGKAFEIAVSLVTQRHPLNLPQKFDEDESQIQRDHRILSQSARCLCKLMENNCENQEALNLLGELFQNNGALKQILSGNTQVQNSFLHLCLLSKSFEESILEGLLPKYIVANLDSETIGKCCFELLLSLLQNERFGTKISIRKELTPKLLHLIRIKSSMRYNCYHYYLPAIALINRFLNEEEKSTFSLRALESFMDNMPLQNAAFIPSWTKSFVETCKYLLKNFENESTIDAVLGLITNGIDYVIDDFVSIGEFSNLIQDLAWIPRNVFNKFLNILQFNVFNRRPESDQFLSALFLPCKPQFLEFHIGTLRLRNLNVNFYEGLLTCTDDYLKSVLESLPSLLEDLYNLSYQDDHYLDKTKVTLLARVSLRIILFTNRLPQVLNSRVTYADAFEFETILLVEMAKLGEKPFNQIERLIRDSEKNIFTTVALNCVALFKKEDLEAFKVLFDFLDENVRENVFSIILQITSVNIPFLSRCLNEFSLKPITLRNIWIRIFTSLFDLKYTLDEQLSIIDTLAKCPVLGIIKDVIPDVLSCYIEWEKFEEFSSVIEIMFQNYQELFNHTICSTTKLNEYHEFLGANLFLRSLPVYEGIFAHTNELPLPDDDENSFASRKTKFDLLTEKIYSFSFISLVTSYVDMETITDDQRKLLSTILVITYTAMKFIKLEHPNMKMEHEDLVLAKMEEFIQQWPYLIRLAVQHLLEIAPDSPTTCQVIRSMPWEFLEEEYKKNINKSWPNQVKLALHAPYISTDPKEHFVVMYHCDYYKCKSSYISILFESKDCDALKDLFSISKDEKLINLNICAVLAAKEFIKDKVNEESAGEQSPELDFILCGLVTSLTLFGEQYKNVFPEDIFERAYISLVFELYSECAYHLKKLNSESVMYKEWNDYYLPTIAPIIYQFLSHSQELQYIGSFVTFALVRAVVETYVVPDYITVKTGTWNFEELDIAGYEEKQRQLISIALMCVQAGNNALQHAGIHLLRILAPVMYKHENKGWNDDQDICNEKRKIKIPIALLHMLSKADEILSLCGTLDAMLAIIESFAEVNEERVACCDAIGVKVMEYMAKLLDYCNSFVVKGPSHREEFINRTLHNGNGVETKHLVYNVVYRLFRSMPAVIRGWYTKLPGNIASNVNKYVKELFTSYLIDDELRTVKVSAQAKKASNDSLKIKTIPVARQVVAEYIVDETTMRLILTLPLNYPLGLAHVELEKSVVPSERTKKWLLQLISFLHFQNGPVVDGILIWRNNVDKDVEGTEACSICLMIVHSTSHQLPKAKCKQCKNKFHSNCLYTWFQSSGKETCPLCRNHFLGSR